MYGYSGEDKFGLGFVVSFRYLFVLLEYYFIYIYILKMVGILIVWEGFGEMGLMFVIWCWLVSLLIIGGFVLKLFS